MATGRFNKIILGTNLSGTDNADDSITIDASGGGGGVDSIEADGAGQLTGDVTLSQGSNITLSQTGNDIEIAAAGGGSGVTVINYTAFTSGVSITGTSAGSPTEVVSSGSISYAAVLHKIEFYATSATITGANGFLAVGLYDNTTEIGRLITIFETPASSWNWGSLYAVRYLTPTAATHLYKIKAWKAGTVSIDAGDGTGDNNSNGFIRITTGS